jgi:hypothetical protein
MKIKLYLLSLLVWLVMAVIGPLNGFVRTYGYSAITGEQAAHVISTIILIVIILIVTFVFFRFVATNYTITDLIFIGTIWLGLTIAFEFGFGHFVMGHPWERLFADYNIIEGRVWIAVPLATLFAPLLMGMLAKRR